MRKSLLFPALYHAMWETYPDAGMAGWGGKDRTAIFPFAGRHHRNKIAHVLLDFCCDWSGAADAGSGDGCFSDPTPRAAGPGGVEVVRQMVSLTSEVRMSKSKAKPHPRSTPAKRRTSAPVPTASEPRRATTKHAQVLALLRGKRGATIRTLAKRLAGGCRPTTLNLWVYPKPANQPEDGVYTHPSLPCWKEDGRSSASTWCQNQAKAVASIASSTTWPRQLKQTE
jgi:hypothetical protein